jgi:hypothetical protein
MEIIPGRLCNAADCDLPHYRRSMEQLGLQQNVFRKGWEFALVLEALTQSKILTPSSYCICFGCGDEPIPAYLAGRYGCRVLATDFAGSSWGGSNLDRLRRPSLCENKKFNSLVSYQNMDMNWIPDSLHGQADFCWSCCSLDHLGSIRLSKRFVYQSLKTIRPGGLVVHTGEYCLDSDWKSPDYQGTVCWTSYDVDEVLSYVRERGIVAPWSTSVFGPRDYVTSGPNNLQLMIAGHRCTSFGLVLKKPAE